MHGEVPGLSESLGGEFDVNTDGTRLVVSWEASSAVSAHQARGGGRAVPDLDKVLGAVFVLVVDLPGKTQNNFELLTELYSRPTFDSLSMTAM